MPFCLTANIPKQSPIDVDDCWCASTMGVMVFLAFFVDIFVVSICNAGIGPYFKCLKLNSFRTDHQKPNSFWSLDHPNQVFKTGVSGDQWRSMFMSIVFLKSRVGLSLHSSLELPVSLLTFAASTTPKMHHLAQNPGNGNGGNYDKVWHLHWQVNRIPMHTVMFMTEELLLLHMSWQFHCDKNHDLSQHLTGGGDPTQALTRKLETSSARDSTGINLHLMLGPWEAYHPGRKVTWWWEVKRVDFERGHLNPLNTLAKQVDSFFTHLSIQHQKKRFIVFREVPAIMVAKLHNSVHFHLMRRPYWLLEASRKLRLEFLSF